MILHPDSRDKGLETEFVGDIAAMIEQTQAENQGHVTAYDRDLLRRSGKGGCGDQI